MAPEILRYEKYDAKADLWSVGAVLYEMSVGKPPFRAQNHVELLRKIEKSEDKISFPEEKYVAQDIKNLIRGLLKRNPIERISFSEFFRIADEVSTVGILAPPKPLQRTMSTASTSLAQKDLQRRIQSLSLAHDGLPQPPPTSSLPPPTSPLNPKLRRSITLNTSEGEPGAFILDVPTSITRRNSTNAAKTSVRATSRPMHHDRSNKAVNLPSSTQPSHPSSGHHPSQHAPSPSVLPLPSTNGNRTTAVPSFPAKYVLVAGGSHSTSTKHAAVGVKTRDYALVPSSKTTQVPFAPKAEDDEDGDFGKEYVVVEKRAVEINALVDDLASSPQKPMSLGRRMSRGFMSRPPLSGFPQHKSNGTSPPPSGNHGLDVIQNYTTSNSSFPPRPNLSPSPPSSGTHPMMITNFGRSSPSQNYQYNPYPSSPRSFDSNGGGGGIGSLPIVGKYFPQSYTSTGNSPRSVGMANTNVTGGGTGVSTGVGYLGFPNSQLARAIMSSYTAFNSRSLNPSHHHTAFLSHTSIPSTSKAMVVGSSSSHSQRSPTSRYSIDSVEAKLMNELEEFASKVLVILQFADEKLAKILPPTPSSTSTTSASQTTTSITNSPPTSIGAFVPVSKLPSSYASKPMSETSTFSSMNTTRPDSATGNIKLAAGEAMVLYIKALAFLDKGIRHAVSVSSWRKELQGQGGGIGFSPEVTFGKYRVWQQVGSY